VQVFWKLWTRRQARLVRHNFLEHVAREVYRIESLVPEIWQRRCFWRADAP
jgi:hypothetical protein